MLALFGISDMWVGLAYLLCILSTLLCVVYGLLNWNRGDDSVKPVDVRWAEHEQKAEKDL